MSDEINSEVTMTLEEAVTEVLVLLTGQQLSYDSQFDRFRSITQHLNRALRTNALELDWSFYHEQMQISVLESGVQSLDITSDYRFRVMNDDAVRLLDTAGIPVAWAYFLPRDALHKYRNRPGLWCSVTRHMVTFSRPIQVPEEGLTVEIPVIREPRMFRLPETPYPTRPGTEFGAPDVVIQPGVLKQEVDFDFPDLITARAAWLYAQTDPVLQPRVQTLEDQMESLKYQAIERDIAFTESPYMNEFHIPVQASIYPEQSHNRWPVSNRGQFGR